MPSLLLLLSLFTLLFMGCADDPALDEGGIDSGVQEPARDLSVPPNPNPDSSLPTPVEGCLSDLQCPNGQICAEQSCRPGQCNREKSCPGGQSCDRSTFSCTGGGEQSCSGHAECAGRGYCLENTCQDVQCVENQHCGPNENCNEQHRCVAQVIRCSDGDGDGYGEGCELGEDCDDGEASINPGAQEDGGQNCSDGIDQNCDGRDVPCGAQDNDGDGVSDADGDCDDNNPNVHPGATEIPYNSINEDCSADTPDNDLDGDGFRHPEDCDDRNANINSSAREVYYNGLDDDCQEDTQDGDQDGDGHLGGPGGPDCNDESGAINPGVEEVPYNSVDDDCNPSTVDDDVDRDGYNRDDDCEDGEASINPGVQEDENTLCGDGIDHNCDGRDPECGEQVLDFDGDGWPDEEDCEPHNAEVHPGQTEIPGNGYDDDCNPETSDVLDLCEDDAFDDTLNNNIWESATAVADGNRNAVQYGALRLCANEENAKDWYSIDVMEGDGLEVDLFFTHSDTVDVDLGLYKLGGNGEIFFIDDSTTSTDNETVYERRASSAGTYYIYVYNYTEAEADYQMTVNVLQGCTDDQVGASGEHNDSINYAYERGQEIQDDFPPVGESRQICDHDEDWYTFSVEMRAEVHIELLFAHGEGDLELEIYNDRLDRVGNSTSSSDDEVIEEVLEAGTYFLRIYGYNGASNRYLLIQGEGQTGNIRQIFPEDEDIQIPDFTGDPGMIEASLDFDAPEGTVISKLTIRDLDINHEWIPDLKLIALWNGEPVVTLWNRQGDEDGDDGGFDDDWIPFSGDDINFDDRVYNEFVGLPATGTFTLRIEDWNALYTGEFVDLDVELEYMSR